MIVVTGATGFIGRAILDELTRQHAVGVAISRQQPSASLTHHLNETVDLETDFIGLREILEQSGMTTLIHLALPPRHSFQSDPQTAENSTKAIDSNLLEACMSSTTLRRVILASSSAVYGVLPPGEEAFSEDHPPAPNSTYGRAKLEQEARWTQASLPGPVTVARIFNVTGPHEPASNVAGAIAQRINGLLEGAELQLQSSQSIRDFVDVRDAANAILALNKLDISFNGPLNLCSGRGTSISSLAETIVSVSGKNVKIMPDGKGGDSRSVGRIGRLGEQTGWRPRFSLEESIRDLWEEAEA